MKSQSTTPKKNGKEKTASETKTNSKTKTKTVPIPDRSLSLISFFGAQKPKTTPAKRAKKQKQSQQKAKPASNSKKTPKELKRDPNNIEKLQKSILILGTGTQKREFDATCILELKKKFPYFSDRKINICVKELLRFGYVVSKTYILGLLSSFENDYGLRTTLNPPKPRLLQMLSAASSKSAKTGNQGKHDNGSLNSVKKAGVSELMDFFCREGLHLKLSERFESVQIKSLKVEKTGNN